MKKNFINLTNGLEAIEKYDLNINELNYMYLASTTIERANYIKLIMDLDHNFLFNLAIGNEVVFYDFGTKKNISKSCYMGINLIRYILTRYWLDLDDESLCFRNTRNSKKEISEILHFKSIYNTLFMYNSTKEKKALKTKLNKYKNKFLLTNKIKLRYISSSTNHDGDYKYYKQIIKTKILKDEN